MRYGVEVAHLYRSEIDDGVLDVGEWAERLRRDVDCVPSWVEDPVFQVFVDDYPRRYTNAEREELADAITEVGENVDVSVDVVAFESDCVAAADELARNLPLVDGWIEHNGNGSRRSTRIVEDDGWTCAALSAVWTLARLGYQPYRRALEAEGVRSLGRLNCERVLTVLPTSYIDVEAGVVQILRDLRKPRVPLHRVAFVFA